MKRTKKSIALVFLSMAATLHLTDQAVRYAQHNLIRPDGRSSGCHQAGMDVVFNLPSGGLGALVECEPNGIRLVSCLPGHAAHTAGLRVGDRIVAIDGELTDRSNEAWALQHLRGKIGTRVVLDVERGDGIWQRTFRTEVVRQQIEMGHSVYSRVRGQELVLKVMWLGPETKEQLIEHLAQAQNGNVDRVILDLTNVSNGDLDSFRECASVFLPANTPIGGFTAPGQCDGSTVLTTEGHPFTDQLTGLKIGPYTARHGELLARALADNLNLEVEGSASAGLGSLDDRTIMSRVSLNDDRCGLLVDAQGDVIEGRPMKPDFWSWSTLLSPVKSALE